MSDAISKRAWMVKILIHNATLVYFVGVMVGKFPAPAAGSVVADVLMPLFFWLCVIMTGASGLLVVLNALAPSTQGVTR